MSTAPRITCWATSAACAVSLALAPWRGTPFALPGDVLLTLVVAASVAVALPCRARGRRDMAAIALVATGAVTLMAVPLVGWGLPFTVMRLVLAPCLLLGVAAAAGVAVHRATRNGGRRTAAAIVVVAATAAVWLPVERFRLRQLRWGAMGASVSAMRLAERQMRDDVTAVPTLQDGWGWPLRIERHSGDFVITSTGAGGRLQETRERGAIASWEDDLVVGPGQTWRRWGPGLNAPSYAEPEPWRDWRTPRWRY